MHMCACILACMHACVCMLVYERVIECVYMLECLYVSVSVGMHLLSSSLSQIMNSNLGRGVVSRNWEWEVRGQEFKCRSLLYALSPLSYSLLHTPTGP